MYDTLEQSMNAREWKVGDLRKKMVLKYSKAPARITLSKAVSGESCPTLEVAVMIHRTMDEDFNIVSLVPENKLKYLQPVVEAEKKPVDDGLDFGDIASDISADDLLEGLDLLEDDIL